jgi:hypothetical protein
MHQQLVAVRALTPVEGEAVEIVAVKRCGEVVGVAVVLVELEKKKNNNKTNE